MVHILRPIIKLRDIFLFHSIGEFVQCVHAQRHSISICKDGARITRCYQSAECYRALVNHMQLSHSFPSPIPERRNASGIYRELVTLDETNAAPCNYLYSPQVLLWLYSRNSIHLTPGKRQCIGGDFLSVPKSVSVKFFR